jgi:uncharacterized protein YuzE
MESVKPLDERGTFEWEYDVQADVLYLSDGEPREGVGIDAGDGLIFRYDETADRLVGVTIVGLRARLVARSGGS